MSVEDPMDVVDAADAGAQLQAARGGAGLSVHEVAKGLRLTVHMVQAIEANDQRQFPARVYLRGYVRAYAKLVGLDPEPLVAAYVLEGTPRADVGVARSSRKTQVSRLVAISVAGAGLVAVVLVLLLIWRWLDNDNTAASAVTPEPVAGEPVAEIVDPSAGGGDGALPARTPLPDASPAADAGAEANLLENTADTTTTLATVADSLQAGSDSIANQEADGVPSEAEDRDAGGGGDGEPEAQGDVNNGAGQAPSVDSQPGVQQTPRDTSSVDSQPGIRQRPSETSSEDSEPRVRRITPQGDAELGFTFTEDCWVEVFDTKGRKLYEDLLRRGQRLRLIGGGPFQVRLGYAPGVALEYNGERVPLAPHTRNNVASLVVGQ